MPVSLCFGGYFVEISDVFWSKDLMFFSETSDVFSLPVSLSFGCYSLQVSSCFGGYFFEISDVFWSKDLMFFSETSDVFYGGFSPQARAAPTSRHSAPIPQRKSSEWSALRPRRAHQRARRTNARKPENTPLLRWWQQGPAPGAESARATPGGQYSKNTSLFDRSAPGPPAGPAQPPRR